MEVALRFIACTYSPRDVNLLIMNTVEPLGSTATQLKTLNGYGSTVTTEVGHYLRVFVCTSMLNGTEYVGVEDMLVCNS